MIFGNKLHRDIHTSQSVQSAPITSQMGRVNSETSGKTESAPKCLALCMCSPEGLSRATSLRRKESCVSHGYHWMATQALPLKTRQTEAHGPKQAQCLCVKSKTSVGTQLQ